MSEEPISMDGPVCPVPLLHAKRIVLGHGSGGKMSSDLITDLFLPPFDNPILRKGNDAGVITLPGISSALAVQPSRIAISTDSHVVWPLFFAGGDIGRLAICGTVNDVSMMGASPLFITAGFILEEGLEFEKLESIVHSMREAAIEAGVEIIAGDTKVVEKGKADCLYITTSGVGVIRPGLDIHGANARPGDIVILSGNLGDHGIAVLEARGELGIKSGIKSDIAPLNHLVSRMNEVSDQIHVLRDPTRGGLATSLNEIAEQSDVCIEINEQDIPVHPSVMNACELLGFDPLYVANEGKLVAIVGEKDVQLILTKMRESPYGHNSTVIGRVLETPKRRVLMKTIIGSTRVVGTLSGEMLPRIC